MAQIPPTTQARPSRSGKKAVRYGVPVAVAGIAAATVGLVPALAAGDPDLPEVTAQELVAKLAASDVDQLSGTVQISTDLGLPALPGGLGGASAGGPSGGGPFGGGPGEAERGGGGEQQGADRSPAAPGAKLMELAAGEHTLRVAADGPDKQRVSVVEDAAEYSLLRNGNEVWAYDSESNSVFHGIGPESAGEHGGKDTGGHALPDGLADLTPKEAAKKALDLADETTSVTVDGTANVAGRDAYRLVIAPKDATHSTVGSLRIAVDAETGAPLKFTLTPDEGGKPVIDIAYTEVDFGKPEAGTFSFDPPKGADVTEERFDGPSRPGKHAEKHAKKHLEGQPEKQLQNHGMPGLSGGGLELLGDGWGTVAQVRPPEGGPGRAGDKGLAGLDDLANPRAQRLLDGFTDEVNGEFGTGRVFETRLFNVLLTDDGAVYAGAVTKEGLIEAADEAK